MIKSFQSIRLKFNCFFEMLFCTFILDYFNITFSYTILNPPCVLLIER